MMGNREQKTEKKIRCVDVWMRSKSLPHFYASTPLRLFLLFALCYLLFATSCFAFPWSKCKKPVIDPKEKMDYVNIDWWDNFSDPCLKYYIIKAIECNHDLRIASWQVETFRQMVKVQFSQELPTISAGATYVGLHIDNITVFGRQNIFSVPFTVRYEPDLFLKNRDKTKSSKKTYEASKFEEKSIYLSLASEVAAVYINIIKFDKQIQLQKCYLQAKKEELLREEKRYKNGTSTAIKVNNIQEDYKTAKNDLDKYIKSRDIALNELAVLIGDSAENAHCLQRNSFDCFEYKSQMPCAIPSDVIFSRPDVLAAERTLEKAKIDIRVARKEFLPRFNILAVYAFTNLDGNFFSWNSAVAAILASVTQDIFTGGRKIANLHIAKARYEQMFENYKQTDLRAIKEIADSLLIIREDTKIDKNTLTNLQIEQDNYARLRKSYTNGVISCTDLLQEREKLLTAEQNQTNSKAARLTDYITLYKAVGGGKCLN